MLSSRLTTELDNYGSRAAAIKITENHVLWAWRAVGYVMGGQKFRPRGRRVGLFKQLCDLCGEMIPG